MSYRVLLTDRAWPDWNVERAILAKVDAEIVAARSTDAETLTSLAAGCHAIGTCWANVPREVMSAAQDCRVISRFGIGLDNIDLVAAKELGIPVTNVPDYCVEEVADHVIALALAHARRIAFFHQRTKLGEYALNAAGPMRRLSEQKVGIVGFGRIGQRVFAKARGLGMKVIAHSRRQADQGTGCEMVSFHSLLEQSDIISINAPLIHETRGMFNSAAFASMKNSALLINTSRGPLVNHDDLWQAIQSEQIAGAALDVFDPEPPDLAQPLYQHERVILTPHAAFVSEESVLELRTRTAMQIATALRGDVPENVVQ